MCSLESVLQYYMTVCSAVTSAVDCLVGITQCTREHTRDAITAYLSLLYSYKYIINRPLDPEANYHNIRHTFQCNDSKFKGVRLSLGWLFGLMVARHVLLSRGGQVTGWI